MQDLHDEHGQAADPMTGLDWTLAIVGGVALLTLLMFATSGMTRAFRQREPRRRILWGCVLAEVILVALILALAL